MEADYSKKIKKRKITEYIVFDAIMAALAVVLMMFLRFPLLPQSAPWLVYDLGDIPAIFTGLVLSPLHGFLVLLLTCLIELVTVSGSGFWGFFMHLLASSALVLLPAFIAKNKKSQARLITGFVSGTLAMLALMIPLNLLITPIYTGMGVGEVAKMIVPVLLPFNLIKGVLHSLVSYLLFMAVKASGILSKI